MFSSPQAKLSPPLFLSLFRGLARVTPQAKLSYRALLPLLSLSFEASSSSSATPTVPPSRHLPLTSTFSSSWGSARLFLPLLFPSPPFDFFLLIFRPFQAKRNSPLLCLPPGCVLFPFSSSRSRPPSTGRRAGWPCAKLSALSCSLFACSFSFCLSGQQCYPLFSFCSFVSPPHPHLSISGILQVAGILRARPLFSPSSAFKGALFPWQFLPGCPLDE